MKSLLMALVTTIMLPGMVVAADTDALIDRSSKAVLLLYSQNAEGGMTMHCTATTFDKSTSSAGYLLVSAAHCLGNDDTTKERAATGKNVPFFVTFDETAQIKKFYPVTVQWVGYQHRGEDFAVLEVHTDETWVMVPLGDEKTLKDGAPIINIASPLGLGKQVFRGSITNLFIDRPIVQGDINWRGAMFLDIPAGGGSSGSALISEKQEAIVGFLVGTVGGDNNVVGIPVSRFKAVNEAVLAGKYKWYVPDDAAVNPDGSPVK